MSSYLKLRAYTSEMASGVTSLFEIHGGADAVLGAAKQPTSVDPMLTDVELFFMHCVKDGYLIGDPWHDVL